MANKKRKTKNYSFIIVPDTQEDSRSFTLSSAKIKFLILLLVSLFVMAVIGVATYWKVAEIALDYGRLEEENFELRNSVKRVEAMTNDLQNMRKIKDKIHNSLSGYMKVDAAAEDDTTLGTALDFTNLEPEKKRTIYNFIPSLLPVNGYKTRGFEVDNLIINPHYGIDIAASQGTPVKAAADGTVLFSGWTVKGGYTLIVQHKFGYTTVYKHNQRNVVSVLERVKKGQVIAHVGDTGEISSGAHVHFEIWSNNEPVNPLSYIGRVTNKN